MTLRTRTASPKPASAPPAAKVATGKAKATQTETVTTAKLLRGRTYWHKTREYLRGVDTVIEDHFKQNTEYVLTDADRAAVRKEAAYLEKLTYRTKDSDGEEFEKQLFEVKYNQLRPGSPEELAGRVRSAPRKLGLRH